MKKVLILAIIVSLCLLGVMLAINHKPLLSSVNDDKVKIGLMVDSLVIERWQKDRDIFISKAKELGAEVILKNANEDADLQIDQVKELIKAKVDVNRDHSLRSNLHSTNT